MKNLPKLDNTNLWDKTFHVLKQGIVERRFKPNEKILLPELAEMLGVSRTPIRDALNRLEKEGLVKTVSKVGTFVTPIDAQTAMDIMDTRLMLESWSIRSFMSRPPVELELPVAELEQLLERSAADLQRLNLKEYLDHNYNFQFHMKIARMGNNAKNVEIYDQLMSYRHILFSASVINEEMLHLAQREHEQIVATIKQGDVDAAMAEVAAHLQASGELLLRQIEQAGGYL